VILTLRQLTVLGCADLATVTVCSRPQSVRFIAAKATSDVARLSSWKTAASGGHIPALGE
jgi:hypothetical protein